MCIRYDGNKDSLIRWSRFMRAWMPILDGLPDGDIFPGDSGVIVLSGGELQLAQWGLLPAWAKDAKFGRKNAYNARSETIFEKPTFRTAIRHRRCVIPVTGFYERSDGRWLRMLPIETEVLALAGIYEPPNAHVATPTFSMVTTTPNARIEPMHDRMPVILSDADLDTWLDPTTDPAQFGPLMVPCPDDWLTVQDAGPVSRAKAPALF